MTTAVRGGSLPAFTFNRWQTVSLFAGFCLCLPLLVLLGSWLFPQPQLWAHLRETVLSDYILNSLLLALGVGIGSLSVGTLLAYLVARYEFPGRAWLSWLLLLPMAIPAYIIAYTYTGMLDFSGPLQSALRNVFGWGYGDYWFPEVRSLGGAICMMVLVLFPYVFMLARTAFAEQSQSLMDAHRSLGGSQRSYFFRVALPLARPAILTGTALTMMEALADFGTVQYFGVSTFTTGIYRTWFGLGNGLAAAQLSTLLCGVVLALLLLEKWSRRTLRVYEGRQRVAAHRVVIRGAKGWSATLMCLLVAILGFLLPLGQLLWWAMKSAPQTLNSEFFALAGNTLWLAVVAALVIVTLAVGFAYCKRLFAHPVLSAQVQVASMGYAVPGTVIAVGVIVPFAALDLWLNDLTEQWFSVTPGLIFSGTLFALVFAYAVRFLSVALHNVEQGLGRITPSMDNAARTLGENPSGVLKRVHLPLMRASLLSAMLLVFVDVLKELPATLILRPFNFNTLAVRSYELASDERLVDAALPAVCIVLVGILPVVLLARTLDKKS